LFEAVYIEAGRLEACHFLAGRPGDIFIETRNLYFTRARIVTLGDQLAELSDGIPSRASGCSGMNVLRSCLQHETERREASQAITDGGFTPSDPDGIGHDDRIGAQGAQVRLDEVFKVGTPDLLLELPDELNIDRQFSLSREARAEECRQCRSLVVGRAASVILPIVRVENERRTFPLRFIGRLHVEMIVDSDSRKTRALKKASDDNRIAGRRKLFCSSTATADVRDGVIGKLLDIPTVFPYRTDAGDLNPFL